MKTNTKPVHKIDLNGNIIKTYDSMSDAERENNIFQSAISMCCRGIRNKAGGFIWKYVEEAKKVEIDDFAKGVS